MQGLQSIDLGGRAVSSKRIPALDPVTRYGLLALVVILFSVSGGLLWKLGYNYDGLSGGIVTKLHPATYLAFLLFLWRACAFGNPVGYGILVTARRPATALMLTIAVVALAFIILRQRPNMAGLVDTFLGSTVLVLLLAEQDDRLTKNLQRIVHSVMTVNALMALFEFTSKILIFPYRFDGEVFATDTRSSALQGHPLANASLTACYVLALLSGAKNIPPGVKLLLLSLQCAALVTFGGRSAMVITILLGGIYILYQGFGALRSRRVNLLGAALGVLVLSLMPVALGVLIYYGFFDALLGRFVSDGGSANARVEMFELFKYFSLQDIIAGPDVDTVESLRRISGLEWGIENPIIRMTLYQGAFMTLIMMIGFGLFMHELTRQCTPGTWLPMIAWLILLNTSESIASKTTLMAKFAIILLCLYPRRQTSVVRHRQA